MSTSLFVQRHINDLSPTSLFTTRELLQYGTRNAVDLTLFKLVNTGVIHRVARGVFRRACLSKSPPSVLDVARAKAAAFCRKIFNFHDVAAYEMGMTSELPSIESQKRQKDEPDGKTSKVIFYSDGSRTSFKYGAVEIEFRCACPRKRKLVDDRVGKYLKALWFLGPMGYVQEQFVALGFDRIERRALKAQLIFMPGWLQALFPKWRSKYRDYELFGAPIFERQESLFTRISKIRKSGNGKSIPYF